MSSENDTLAIRPMEADDIPLVVRYWTEASDEHMLRMGVDLDKRPTADNLSTILQAQLAKPLAQKRSFCLIWLLNEQPVGHCNTNPTYFGDHAFMHLHMWPAEQRASGLGSRFVKLCLPVFFKTFDLKVLYCQPYALNPAPNRTLEKLGFKLDRELITTPGSINFEQPVKRWRLTPNDLLNATK